MSSQLITFLERFSTQFFAGRGEKAKPNRSVIESITAEAVAWLEALAKNGVLTIDSRGNADFAPGARELVDALHEVLAGGSVRILVDSRGHENAKAELDEALYKAVKSANVPDREGHTITALSP